MDEVIRDRVVETVHGVSLRERVYHDIMSRIGYYSFITFYTPSIKCPACGAGMRVEEQDNGDMDDYSKMARAVVLHLHGLTQDEMKAHYMVLARMAEQERSNRIKENVSMNRQERSKLEDDTYNAIWSTRGGVFFSRTGPEADDIHYFCPLCNERIDRDTEPDLYLEVLHNHLYALSDEDLQSHYMIAVMRDPGARISGAAAVDGMFQAWRKRILTNGLA